MEIRWMSKDGLITIQCENKKDREKMDDIYCIVNCICRPEL